MTTKQANPSQSGKRKELKKIKDDIQNGHADVSMVRETSPDGHIVVHAVKKSGYVHERLHSMKRISDAEYDAAERFANDFIRASLDGRYASLDMNRSAASSRNIMSDSTVEARQRVRAAQDSLGASPIDKSLSKSCVWFVVGCGDTLEKWALRVRNNGDLMSEGKACGILMSALERLAMHYGLTNEGKIRHDIGQTHFTKGIQHAIAAAESFKPSHKQTPEDAIKAFAQMLRKKFAQRLTQIQQGQP